MSHGRTVLLVSAGGGTHAALQNVLKDAGVEVHFAESCAEVQKILKGLKIPEVLFADTDLPDGTWMDILALAKRAHQCVPVVVVSRVVDVNLYITALESGASDFIVPPFYRQDIAHVLQCAAEIGRGADDFRIPGVAAA